MLVHLPSAVSYRIRENTVLQHVILIQQIISLNTPALPIARNNADPIEVQIFHTVIPYILQMIPDSVDTFQQFVANNFTIPDNIVILATQFDPPITGIHVGEMRQPSAALLELGQLSTLHMGADTVAMLSVFQIFLGILICPVRTDKLHRLSSVYGREHQCIAHRILIRFRRRIRLMEFIASFAAHPSGSASHGRQRAMSRGIHEDITIDCKFCLCGVLMADNGRYFFAVHNDIVHIGIQISIKILLKMHFFPDHGIEYRKGRIGIPPLIFQ